jgi:hypothetical protein
MARPKQRRRWFTWGLVVGVIVVHNYRRVAKGLSYGIRP